MAVILHLLAPGAESPLECQVLTGLVSVRPGQYWKCLLLIMISHTERKDKNERTAEEEKVCKQVRTCVFSKPTGFCIYKTDENIYHVQPKVGNVETMLNRILSSS